MAVLSITQNRKNSGRAQRSENFVAFKYVSDLSKLIQILNPTINIMKIDMVTSHIILSIYSNVALKLQK